MAGKQAQAGLVCAISAEWQMSFLSTLGKGKKLLIALIVGDRSPLQLTWQSWWWDLTAPQYYFLCRWLSLWYCGVLPGLLCTQFACISNRSLAKIS